MTEYEKDLDAINVKVADLFEQASLIKFAYAGIYILEFEIPRDLYGFNYFFVDIGTHPTIFDISKVNQPAKEFTIENFLMIWSENVTSVNIDKGLNLSILFENNICCRIPSNLPAPENLPDMRWSIYQKRDVPGFFLYVSDDDDIYLQIP